MDNPQAKSIAQSLYEILADKLDNNLIQRESDIIAVIDTKKCQIKGMLTPDGVDNYRIVFEDQSLLTVTLLGGEGDMFTEIEMTHGYFVPDNKRN